MSNLFKLARKFQLKLVLAQNEGASIDYSVFKEKAKLELVEIIDKMAKKVRESGELREVAFKLSADPFATFGEKAEQGISNTRKIIEEVSKLYSSKEKLSVEDMIHPFIKIATLINEEATANGSDKWGINRKKFLNLIEAYGDYFTTQTTYGDPSVLNSMAKRFLENKIGRLTNSLDVLAFFLTNSKGTGALDILRKMSRHGQIDDTKLDNLLQGLEHLGDTSRVTKNLENHEKENFVRLVHDLIGLTGLHPLNEWNEFIQPYEDMVNIAKRIWFTPQFKKLWGHAPKSTLKEVLEESPNLSYKLDVLKDHIVPLVAAKRKKEQLSTEKMFGAKDVVSPILPKKNVRELISRLSADERRIWNLVPKEIKDEVLSGARDLDDVLEEFEAE